MKVPAAFIIDKVVDEACVVKTYFLKGLICKMLLAVKTAGHLYSQYQQYEINEILFCLIYYRIVMLLVQSLPCC